MLQILAIQQKYKSFSNLKTIIKNYIWPAVIAV